MTNAFGKPAFIRLFVVKIVRNKKDTISCLFKVSRKIKKLILMLACIAKRHFWIAVLHQL